jgi:hypothetical protein
VGVVPKQCGEVDLLRRTDVLGWQVFVGIHHRHVLHGLEKRGLDLAGSHGE